LRKFRKSKTQRNLVNPGVDRITKSTNVRVLYIVVLVGIILYLILDAVAQLLPPHYSPISQAESDLAVGPFGLIMTINFINRGIFSLVFLFSFAATIRLTGEKVAQYRGGLYLFSAWSIGALLLAFFPTDVPATPISWHGVIHLAVAIVAFITGAFGALLLSIRMSENKTLRNVRRFALPIGILAVVFCLIEFLTTFFAPHLTSKFGGLFERLFLGTMLAWIGIVAAYSVNHKEMPIDPSVLK